VKVKSTAYRTLTACSPRSIPRSILEERAVLNLLEIRRPTVRFPYIEDRPDYRWNRDGVQAVAFGSVSAWDAIVAVTSDAVIVFDSRFRIIMCNERAERLFGFEADEVIGETVDVLIPERFLQCHRGMMEQFRRASTATVDMAYEVDMVALGWDGTEIPVRIGVSMIESDAEGSYVLALKELTPFRDLEEAAERSKRGIKSRSRMLRSRCGSWTSPRLPDGLGPFLLVTQRE